MVKSYFEEDNLCVYLFFSTKYTYWIVLVGGHPKVQQQASSDKTSFDLNQSEKTA